jgi:drug/metabolite transporter (DMT)-like permease
MFTAAVLFSIMGAATKAVTRNDGGPAAPALTGSEVALFRYAFGLFVLIGLRLTRGVDLLGSNRRGLLLRGVYGGIASVSFFVGIQMTSLTHATLLNYTVVIWGPLFAVFILQERLTGRGMMAIAAGMVGMLLVTRPEAGHANLGDAIALLSGVLSGLAVVQIRRLRQGESAYAVFFYFNLLGLPIALLSTLATHTPLRFPAPAQWPLLLIVGATSVSAQLLMTYGYRVATAAQGSLITLTSVAFSATLAWQFFGEEITASTVIGGALVLAAALLFAVSGARPKTAGK